MLEEEEEEEEEVPSWPPRECPLELRCRKEDRSVGQWSVCLCLCVCVCRAHVHIVDIPTSMSVKWVSNSE